MREQEVMHLLLLGVWREDHCLCGLGLSNSLLDPFDIAVGFEHQARHMDWLVFRHVERFERIRSFLVRCAEVDADDFPDSEAASGWVVFHAESISDGVSFDFHKGLTSQCCEWRFASCFNSEVLRPPSQTSTFIYRSSDLASHQTCLVPQLYVTQSQEE